VTLANQNQSSILDRMKLSGKLPTPKGIAMEVINLTKRENVANHEVTHLISADPALSMSVIKAANVLSASPSRSIMNINDAVTVLGFRSLRQLVLGIALIGDHQKGPCRQFDYASFWIHSLLTAIAVRQLAEQSRLAASEEIFTLGLLGGIGKLALATVFSTDFGAILEQSKNCTLEQLYSKEREKFGFEEAELTAAMLADMNFPAIFQRLIHDYPQPQSSGINNGSREWKLMNMLHLASKMADVFLAPSLFQTNEIKTMWLSAHSLGIEESELIKVIEHCVDQWSEWTSLLKMVTRQITSFAELAKQVEHEAVESNLQLSRQSNSLYKMRVLVVEDDRSMRLILQKMLQSAGHHVAVATDGAEALTLLDKERPQLIITDWIMPEMDGITLCKKLRARDDFRDVYIIVETAQESQDKLMEAFEAGADDYVLKPITAKMFHARLRAAQRVIQMQDELEHDRAQLLNYSNELADANARLKDQVLHDTLTGLYNRRYAMERLAQEWALSKRGDRTLSCLMLDIDHFKGVNDQYGHIVGDEALKLVAHTLRQTARGQDVVCRYGGEEFLVICPDTKMNEAHECAERLRTNVAEQKLVLKSGVELKMTISVGGVEKKESIDSMEKLLICADNNLYAAKKAGRNKTVVDK
jgi:diguanylate cyclase (GGDEF)-like protein